MPYFRANVTKEVLTEVYIEAKDEDSIRNLYDDQMADIIQEQSCNWEDCGWVDINTLEEISEEDYSQYEGTNLEQFLNE